MATNQNMSKPKAEAKTPAPLTDTPIMVGVVTINRQHERFGQAVAQTIAQQAMGIWGNRLENPDHPEKALKNVDRLFVVDKHSRNIIGVFDVQSWATARPELLPFRPAEDCKKKGVVALGLTEVVGHSLIGKSFSYAHRYVYGVTVVPEELLFDKLVGEPNVVEEYAPVATEIVVEKKVHRA